jgi:hypothetical protein
MLEMILGQVTKEFYPKFFIYLLKHHALPRVTNALPHALPAFFYINSHVTTRYQYFINIYLYILLKILVTRGNASIYIEKCW